MRRQGEKTHGRSNVASIRPRYIIGDSDRSRGPGFRRREFFGGELSAHYPYVGVCRLARFFSLKVPFTFGLSKKYKPYSGNFRGENSAVHRPATFITQVQRDIKGMMVVRK